MTERRFEFLSAAMIGAVAVLAAVLAVVQIDTGQRAARAQQQGARLAADLSARLQTTGFVSQFDLVVRQASLTLSTRALAHQAAGLTFEDPRTGAVGEAEADAAERLGDTLDAAAATSGGEPLDPYTAGMLKTSVDQLWAEVKEQNRQVDLAEHFDHRNSLAILGLSFLALAGVLVGLAAVLRQGRAGWFALASAGAMTIGAGGLAVLAVL